MLSLLPIGTFVLLFWHRRRDHDWREAALRAAVAWGVLVTAVTELLSLPGSLSRETVAAAWLLLDGALAVVVLRRGRSVPPPGPQDAPAAAPAGAAPRDRTWLWLVPLGLLMAALGVIALVVPPNNSDSMAYHMSRVAHWAQNHSVSHYPTHIVRQLYQGPWAEFAILQFQLLADGDRLANLVQWFALAGVVIGSSLVARAMGASRRGQVFAAVVSGTAPIALLESTTTQNDLVMSFWMVCFVFFALEALRRARPDRSLLVAAGCSLGLLALTKSAAYLLALPFCAWFLVLLVSRSGRSSLRPLALVAAAALVLNVGHVARNVRLSGSPLGPTAEGPAGMRAYTNDIFTPRAWASNVMRNVANQLAVPFAPVNDSLERGVRAAHAWLGADVDDPRTTWSQPPGLVPFRMWGSRWNNENCAANPLHFVVAVAACLLLVASPSLRSAPRAAYVGCIVGAFLLFALLIRWQPWHTRLHLPLLTLAAVPVALVLDGGRRWLAAPVLAAMLALAVPYVTHGALHPVFGPNSVFRLERRDQYFMDAPGLLPFSRDVAAACARGRCENVGLELGSDDAEYPLLVSLRAASATVRVEHVNVANESAGIAAGRGFTPELIVTVDGAQGRLGLRWVTSERR